MLKTGIAHISQISQSARTPFRKELKNISITLYDQITDNPHSEKLAEDILFLFSDERGAYKRTYTKRFEDFDINILNILQKYVNSNETLLIQDVGISDGRTAVDFFEKISHSFPNNNFYASDYNPKVYVLEQDKIKVTLSHTNKILEIFWKPFVFNMIKRDSYRHYPLNHIIRLIIEYFRVRPLIKDYQTGKIKAKELFLFSPVALNLEKKDQRFHLLQHDLLTPFKSKSHVIRAMNILNLSYFSELEFKNVLNHLYDGLSDGGLLITGSNEEAGSIVQGGVYQKTRQGFKKIWQSGNGSPIDHKILLENFYS